MAENGGKLMPNLDQQTTKALNLTVLQRVDQFVEEILITAAHVTLYEFNIDLSQWSRKDVEGSLFVVKRNKQPRFQFIVMNRRNEDNLVENLLGDFEFEIQVPYLLYRNASQEVNGIWFYNPQECKEVFNLFSRILNAYAKVPAKLSVPSGKSEFEELEAVPTMASMDGPLEPSSATTSDVTDVPSNHLFASFFGTALSLGSGVSGALMPPSIPPAVVPTVAPLSAPNVYNPHILDVPQNNHLSSRTANNAPLSAPNVYNPHILDVPQNSHLSNRTANNAPLSAPNVCNPHILGIPQNSHLGSRTANDLVKPSLFFNPSPPVSSSSIPTAPPLDPSGNRPYGTPLLQPFPPPTPSSSLTPIPAPALNHGPGYTREEVRNVLLSLVQDDQFIDIVHRALLKARTS